MYQISVIFHENLFVHGTKHIEIRTKEVKLEVLNKMQ